MAKTGGGCGGWCDFRCVPQKIDLRAQAGCPATRDKDTASGSHEKSNVAAAAADVAAAELAAADRADVAAAAADVAAAELAAADVAADDGDDCNSN